MINVWKTTGALIGLGACGVTYAQAVFEITPQWEDVTVSGSASQNYVLKWDVKNKTSITTTPVFSGWGVSNKSNALTILKTTCNTPVLPGGTCTITMGIRGDAMTRDSLIVAPKFCIPSNQACSIPTQNNRLKITRASVPVPQGTWKVHTSIIGPYFPEFLSINYPTLAIGVMNANYMPTVFQCPDLNSPDNCTLLGNGIIPYNFESITNLSYDANGSLYGLFTRPQIDAINPTRSYAMTIPAGSDTWREFAPSFFGTALGLDTNSRLGILLSSSLFHSVPSYGYPEIGSAKLYSGNGVGVNAQLNVDAANLSVIVDDGLGHVYVAGAVSDYATTPMPEPTSRVWRWDVTSSDPTTAFTAITMPHDIPLITAMVSDGHGTVYIAGSDSHTDGRVWKYTEASGLFVDTGLTASSVTTLYFSPYGYLIAGGVDNVNYVGAVWSYSAGVWSNLNLTDSTSVVSIAADANNDILATGFDTLNNPTIWLHN